jgi:hypothetical protein
VLVTVLVVLVGVVVFGVLFSVGVLFFGVWFPSLFELIVYNIVKKIIFKILSIIF